jgi:predicted amidophosphoribosyltransferase
MPSLEIFKARDGTEIPLVPVPFCHYCSIPLKDTYGRWGLCRRCSDRFRALQRENPGGPRVSPYSFTRAVAAGLYITDSPEKGSVGKMIKGLKAQGRFCEVLADAIVHVLRTRGPEISWDVIVAVPASPGVTYSPASMLAKELGERTRTASSAALRFDSPYVSGQGLPEPQKFDNMRDKVRVAERMEITGMRILLVDDILTTGGAAHWCAGELLKAGAKGVHAAVAGRSIDLRELEFIGYSGPL